MDDKTRGIGDDDVAGFGEESPRNLGPSATTPGTRPTSTRSASTSRTRSTSTSRSNTPREEDLDRETDMRTRELQAEIADTREDMSETIEAIQDRLRPSSIVSNATDAVKSATTDRVRNLAGSASDTASDVARQTRRKAADVVEGARRNPYPALMIGAGIAWLLMDRSKKQDSYGSGRTTRDWSRYDRGEYETRGAYDRAGYRNPVAAGTGVDFDEPDYADVDYSSKTGGDYGTDWNQRNRTSGMASNVTSRASDMAGDARQALTRTTRTAQNGLQRMLRDNPLLVGAAAVLVGAAVGAAIPETEKENQLMGETRDTVVNQAQDMARNVSSTVQEVATDAAKQVADRVSTDVSSTGGSNTNTNKGPGNTTL